MKYTVENSFDYENGFILTSAPHRLGNILAHYELYKKIVHLPGDVVELGVFKGNSLIQFATFRSLLENDKSRKIIGFDAFGTFPKTMGGGVLSRRRMKNLLTYGMSNSKTSLYLAKILRLR